MNPYIQITTICNYHCPHCCFSCTKKGEYMSMKTLRKTLESFDNRFKSITIGGGEPTLHPKFWEMIGLCLTSGFYGENLWMATNGSQKEMMRRLADMARNGILQVSVSNDHFHPPLDADVKKWFTRETREAHSTFYTDKNDLRSFHGDFDTPIKAGRWKKGAYDRCCCEGPFIKPDGKVYQCGCPNGILTGNVVNGYEPCENAFTDQDVSKWEYCARVIKVMRKRRKEKKAGKEIVIA